jgi:hypothetical protein
VNDFEEYEESVYQEVIQKLTDEMRKRAGELADFLVTQPPRKLAMDAVLTFGWWVAAETTTHDWAVTERFRRQQQARQSAGTTTKG